MGWVAKLTRRPLKQDTRDAPDVKPTGAPQWIQVCVCVCVQRFRYLQHLKHTHTHTHTVGQEWCDPPTHLVDSRFFAPNAESRFPRLYAKVARLGLSCILDTSPHASTDPAHAYCVRLLLLQTNLPQGQHNTL